MTVRFLLLFVIAAAVFAWGFALAGDGMAACQSTHSFDVCFDALH